MSTFHVELPPREDNEVIYQEEVNISQSSDAIKATEDWNYEFVFSQMVVVQEIRLERLRKMRLWFGISVIVSLCLLAICLALHVPYEPAAAILCCCAGTFVVFAMKVYDATKQ